MSKQYLYWPDNVRLPDSDCESEYLCGRRERHLANPEVGHT